MSIGQGRSSIPLVEVTLADVERVGRKAAVLGELRKAGFPVRLTSPVRTILDVAEAGMSPDQVSLAIRQAVERGLVTPSQLRDGGRERGRRVESLVTGALGAMPA